MSAHERRSAAATRSGEQTGQTPPTPEPILIARFKAQCIQGNLIHVLRSECFTDGFQFAPPFSGGFWIRHVQSLERIHDDLRND